MAAMRSISEVSLGGRVRALPTSSRLPGEQLFTRNGAVCSISRQEVLGGLNGRHSSNWHSRQSTQERWGSYSSSSCHNNKSRRDGRLFVCSSRSNTNSSFSSISSSGMNRDSINKVWNKNVGHRSQQPLGFKNLNPNDIRHPLDRQNTALLAAVPGLSDFGRALLGPIPEQMLVLENLGTGVLVSERQLSGLHSLMKEAADILGMTPPDVYVRQNPVPNAYTLAITGRKPFIVMHTSLIELLSPAEVQAVMAHELGHLKCDHGIWLTFANLIAMGAYSVPGFGAMIARNMEDQLFRWLRAAELTCDRAALLVAQDSKVVVSALMKLAGGSPILAEQLNVDAFLEQARSYDEAANSSPLTWYLQNAQTRQLSHPLPVLRAREIDRWARSQEFKALLDKGRALREPESATKKVDSRAP